MHAVQPSRARPEEGLAGRLEAVRRTIQKACYRADRDPAGVRIVAVTKGHPVEVVRAAITAGLDAIAENRVHEALRKFGAEGISAPGVERHMVGHLQRNKVRHAVQLFDWIQSVDSVRLARAISDRAADRPMRVLVQVNAAGESQKHGFAPARAVEHALEIAALPGLRVRGLMGMAPWVDDEAALRETFGRLRALFEALRQQWSGPDPPDTLSMGMSNDFELAVEEGATMIRLGTVLFGPRPESATRP